MHRLLARQLRKAGIPADLPPGPEAWERLLVSVGRSYDQHDEGRYLMEQSMETLSREMRALYDELAASQAEQAALRRVATAVAQRDEIGGLLGLVAREAGAVTGCRGARVLRVRPGDDPVVVAEWTAGDAAGTPALHPASAPITVGGEPWGALTVMGADPSATPRAAALLVDFAELVAVALANAADRSRLAELAATDSLTGLANHRAFQERLQAETARAVRHGTPLSLMLLDLDGFKGVNDALGHQAGDEVLVALAALILPRVRDGELLARVGGEEFALLLPLADAEDAMTAAERLRREVAARPLGPVDHQTVSIGVCDLATAGGDPAELFRLADGALYWAKRSGRNRSVRYRPDVVTELSAGDRALRAARLGSAAAIRALARAVDARDPSTRAHSNRVADLAAMLAEELGWPADRVALLRESAIVHDVGKIGIADAVLSKPGRLTPREYEHVKEHATLGARIVRGVLDEEQTSWVRHHHEHWDGRGYPDGLHAHEIPEGARIIGLADAWDAMTGQRAYRDRLGAAAALEECRRCGGTHFDPEIVLVLEQLARAGRLDPPEPEVPSAAPDEPLGEADPGVGVPGGDPLVLGEGEHGPVAGLPLQEVAPPTA